MIGLVFRLILIVQAGIFVVTADIVTKRFDVMAVLGTENTKATIGGGRNNFMPTLKLVAAFMTQTHVGRSPIVFRSESSIEKFSSAVNEKHHKYTHRQRVKDDSANYIIPPTWTEDAISLHHSHHRHGVFVLNGSNNNILFIMPSSAALTKIA